MEQERFHSLLDVFRSHDLHIKSITIDSEDFIKLYSKLFILDPQNPPVTRSFTYNGVEVRYEPNN
jgi:hypothetical protein